MKLISDSFRSLGNQLDSRLAPVFPDPNQLNLLKQQLKKGELILPDDTLQHMVRSTLERDFLTRAQSVKFKPQPFFKEQGWVQIRSLPLTEERSKPLFPMWQQAISSMHNLELRLCYVLLRQDGETSLYLGAIPTARNKKSDEARCQLIQSVACQIPGISMDASIPGVSFDLSRLTCCGAVTGLPSTRKITAEGEYQTMDQISRGLRGETGEEQNFALVILADPVQEQQITDTLRTLENLWTEVNSIAQYTRTDSTSITDNLSLSNSSGSSGGIHIGLGVNASVNLGTGLAEMLRVGCGLGANVSGGVNWGKFLSVACSQGVTGGSSDSLVRQHINKSAQNCVELLNKHIARLQEARNLGFWKTGVYVLAESQSNVQTVMGMIRAVYSGDETYVEPIRTHTLPVNSGADARVSLFQQLPCPDRAVAQALGSLFEDYTTPMTTKELAIATSLPRQEAAGLRPARVTVPFAVNPGVLSEGPTADLGSILHVSGSVRNPYRISLDRLCRHVLAAGASGTGKTVTCKTLLTQARKAGIPFLVIEPAKTDFLHWAIRQNQQPGTKKIRIFAPGFYGIDGQEELKINPFQPTVAKGAWTDMTPHLGRVRSVLRSSISMEGVVSLVMGQVLNRHAANGEIVKHAVTGQYIPILDGPFQDDPDFRYPRLSDMQKTAEAVIKKRDYSANLRDDILGAVETRLDDLLQGWKKNMLDCDRSMDFSELFDQDCAVINLSRLTDEEERSLVMSLILIALWEYRESRYETDGDYRIAADRGQLQHLTLVDEAHQVMPRQGSSAQLHASRLFATMLKEVRAYGEGMVIADQAPTELIADAIKNTSLKIVHALNSADDIREMALSLNLHPEQAQVISVLQPGEAIVRGTDDHAALRIRVDPPDGQALF